MEEIIAHLCGNGDDTTKWEDAMAHRGENCCSSVPELVGKGWEILGADGRAGLDEHHLVRVKPGNGTAAGNG